MARTRDPAVDRAIHRAAVEVLAEVGHGGLTFEAVARRAGVARTTLYRRYGDVGGLLAAAVDDLLPVVGRDVADAVGATAPSRGERWRTVVRSLRAALVDSPVGLRLLASLVVAGDEQPDLLELWRARVVRPRVRLVAAVLEVEAERAQLVGELAFGGLVARYLARGRLDDRDADELADVLLGLAGPAAAG